MQITGGKKEKKKNCSIKKTFLFPEQLNIDFIELFKVLTLNVPSTVLRT